jgi:hypothetical protein
MAARTEQPPTQMGVVNGSRSRALGTQEEHARPTPRRQRRACMLAAWASIPGSANPPNAMVLSAGWKGLKGSLAPPSRKNAVSSRREPLIPLGHGQPDQPVVAASALAAYSFMQYQST